MSLLKKVKHTLSAVGLILVGIQLIGCADPEPDFIINAKLNPYNISPLTAVLEITSKDPCAVTFKVLGESPIEQSFSEFSGTFAVPIVGLYPAKENNVLVTLKYKDHEVKDTVKITTANIPNFFPSISIDKIDRSKMEPGFHGCDIHYANHGKFRSMPMIFDDQGIVRWYLDLSFAGKMVSPFQKLKDGNILMVDRFNIYEFDMLGRALKRTTIDNNYGMHHDVVELPNGDLLICVGKRDGYLDVDGEQVLSDSDYIIHFDRKTSTIAKEWDLAKHLDVRRNEYHFLRPGDWLHMNGLAFNPNDSTITVSGKIQGIANITWKDELKWILTDQKGWNKSGRNNDKPSVLPFVLTAVDNNGKAFQKGVQDGLRSASNFDFPLGQHAPELLPNGNLLVFDNGSNRATGEKGNYSRAVEYQIDENQKTVTQVWQYGKERGDDFYSLIVGDVDYLPKTKNILVTSGYIMPGGNTGKIVEVDYKTGQEVFEATLTYKTLNGNKTGAWGEADILYRSERMELKY